VAGASVGAITEAMDAITEPVKTIAEPMKTIIAPVIVGVASIGALLRRRPRSPLR
jgi:hypothetical protein